VAGKRSHTVPPTPPSALSRKPPCPPHRPGLDGLEHKRSRRQNWVAPVNGTPLIVHAAMSTMKMSVDKHRRFRPSQSAAFSPAELQAHGSCCNRTWPRCGRCAIATVSPRGHLTSSPVVSHMTPGQMMGPNMPNRAQRTATAA